MKPTTVSVAPVEVVAGFCPKTTSHRRVHAYCLVEAQFREYAQFNGVNAQFNKRSKVKPLIALTQTLVAH